MAPPCSGSGFMWSFALPPLRYNWGVISLGPGCLFLSFSFSSRRHRSARKGPYVLRPVSQQSPQGCPRNSANIVWLNTDRSRPWRVECRPLPFSTPLSFRAINAVMLWLLRVEKVPQTSEHLCPGKLQTRCDICCACQAVCSFIPTDSGINLGFFIQRRFGLGISYCLAPWIWVRPEFWFSTMSRHLQSTHRYEPWSASLAIHYNAKLIICLST